MRSRRLGALVAAAVTVVGLLVGGLDAAGPAAAADPTSDAQNAVNWAGANGYRSAVAVVDTETGQLWGAGDIDGAYVTESLVKLFIATRLLVEGQMSGFNETTAYKMITQSDDASANALYGRVGGDGILPWVAAHYGIANLGGPPPDSGHWGATVITARGLAQFYAAVRFDPVVWPWLGNAMHQATPNGSDGFYQFFGIPSATSGSGVKQGWGSDTPTGVAEQNSTGLIEGDRFAVVILTQGPGYGGALSNAVTTEAQLLLPGGTLQADRFEVTDADGTAWAKDGNVNAPWVAVAAKAAQVVVQGNRFALVDTSGLLSVKDGALDGANWVAIADHVAAVALAGSRIAIVDTHGRLYVKEGGLTAGWFLIATGVTAVAADGTRVGAITTAGDLIVKDGPVTALWTTLATGAKQLSLSADRVGALFAKGVAQVKAGALTAPWVVERTDARDVQVTRSRVGVLTTAGAVVVKDGALEAPWVTEADGVQSMTLRDNRVGVHGVDDQVLVKIGFLDAQWVRLYEPGATLALG